MYWLSDKLIWLPLYVFLIFLLIRKYHRNVIWILLFVAITITLSDQISVLIKNLTMRPRPCHDEALAMVVHTVRDKCGGPYSFVSSHAASTFALATFLIPFLGKSFKYFNILILLWAALVSYSRIYLGVHYPGDVLFGSILGIIIGYSTSAICLLILNRQAACKTN
nr:phosphatase PAP2 family protein [Bacteroidota bacterium]